MWHNIQLHRIYLRLDNRFRGIGRNTGTNVSFVLFIRNLLKHSGFYFWDTVAESWNACAREKDGSPKYTITYCWQLGDSRSQGISSHRPDLGKVLSDCSGLSTKTVYSSISTKRVYSIHQWCARHGQQEHVPYLLLTLTWQSLCRNCFTWLTVSY